MHYYVALLCCEGNTELEESKNGTDDLETAEQKMDIDHNTSGLSDNEVLTQCFVCSYYCDNTFADIVYRMKIMEILILMHKKMVRIIIILSIWY